MSQLGVQVNAAFRRDEGDLFKFNRIGGLKGIEVTAWCQMNERLGLPISWDFRLHSSLKSEGGEKRGVNAKL